MLAMSLLIMLMLVIMLVIWMNIGYTAVYFCNSRHWRNMHPFYKMKDNLVDGCVKLVEEEGEGLLALQRCSREQVTVPQAELNLENAQGFNQSRSNWALID